jgi:hypothetical protein
MNDRMTDDIQGDWARSESASHGILTVVLMSTYDVENRPAGPADCGAAANLHTESLNPDLLTRLWRPAH